MAEARRDRSTNNPRIDLFRIHQCPSTAKLASDDKQIKRKRHFIKILSYKNFIFSLSFFTRLQIFFPPLYSRRLQGNRLKRFLIGQFTFYVNICIFISPGRDSLIGIGTYLANIFTVSELENNVTRTGEKFHRDPPTGDIHYPLNCISSELLLI